MIELMFVMTDYLYPRSCNFLTIRTVNILSIEDSNILEVGLLIKNDNEYERDFLHVLFSKEYCICLSCL